MQGSRAGVAVCGLGHRGTVVVGLWKETPGEQTGLGDQTCRGLHGREIGLERGRRSNLLASSPLSSLERLLWPCSQDFSGSVDSLKGEAMEQFYSLFTPTW